MSKKIKFLTQTLLLIAFLHCSFFINTVCAQSISPAKETPLVLTPKGKLQKAKTVFREAKYELLVGLLKDIAETDDLLEFKDERTEARQLLGVGYFFEAQNAKTPEEKADFLNKTKNIFWILLQEAPDHRLDEFVFPASILEVFNSVRTEHAEDLKALKKAKNPDSEAPVFYIERNVERKIWAINLMPFGIGQFQNEQPVKGTLFAVVQTLALGINVASFLTIESLRDSETGRFSTSPDGGDFATAILWRNIMWASLGVFVASYAGSVWDGINFFEETKIRIRTLDEPPPELENRINPQSAQSSQSDPGKVFSLPIGLSYSWTF